MQSTALWRSRAAASAAGFALLVLTLTACSPSRSVKAYCDTVEAHKARYLAAMNDASSTGSLAGLLEAGSAIGDLKSMWDDLAKVAPDDIQTDTETVRDAWDKASDDAGDRNFFGAAVVALSSAAAMQRVNDYIAKNCGVDAAPVLNGQTGSASPSPSGSPASAHSAETVAVPSAYAAWDVGPHAVITGDAADQSGSTDALQFTMKAATGGQLVDSTGTIPAPPDGSTVTQVAYGAQQEDSTPSFAFAATTHTSSSGLTPESWTTSLQAYDATGTSDGTTQTVAACASAACTVNAVTRFGDVAVLSYTLPGDRHHLEGIDLATGAVAWTASNVEILTASGSLLVLGRVPPGVESIESVFAVDSQTGTTAWIFHDPAGHPSTGIEKVLSPTLALIESPASDTTTLRCYSVTDLSTGAIVASRYADRSHISAAYDPTTDRVVLAGVTTSPGDANPHPRFETLDKDGSTVFAIPAAQYAALGSPSVDAALDGQVWIEGQHGTDEVDSATGKQSPESPLLTGSSGTTPLPMFIEGSVAFVSTNTTADAAPQTVLITATGSPTAAEIAATAN